MNHKSIKDETITDYHDKEKSMLSGENVLSIKNLSVDFDSHDNCVHAVKNISFDVKKGKTFGLVGESGSGKSVSALSILKLLPYPYASHPSGEISYKGENILGFDKNQLRELRGNQISMIFQEPLTALNPLHTIEKQINEMLILHRAMSNAQAQKKVLELLDQVGIKNPRQRLQHYPHQLSGGQRQRVMIAMALANDPDVLIADEPTTALDVTVQRQILELLSDLQAQRGLSILMISHDLNMVKHICDHVAVMKSGEIVEQGTTDDIFNHAQHSYTQMLIDSEPTGEPNALEKNAKDILIAENLKVWFAIKKGVFQRTVDHIKAVDDVSIKVKQGQTIGVVGESGSGKTTLALALLRLYQPQGKIIFCDQDITNTSGSSLRAIRKDMQIVFQDPFGSLSPRMSILQIVEEGLLAHERSADKAQREQRVIKVLQDVGIDPELRHRYPHEFSGGQRQRICIARALILKPKLMVLDEPTSALDRSVQAQVLDLLKKIQKDYQLAYIFISHDLKVVKTMSHHIVVMQAGKVVEQGSNKQIFNNPQKEYTQTLLGAAFY